MPERRLSIDQKTHLKDIREQLLSPEPIVLEKNGNHEMSVADAVIGLIFANIAKKEGNPLERTLIRKLSGQIVNGDPGSRILFEAEHGFDHHERRYTPTGRNHSGRVRSR